MYRRGMFRNILWSVTAILFFVFLLVFLIRTLLGAPSGSPSADPAVSPTSDAAYKAGWSDGYDAGYKEGYTYGKLEARSNYPPATVAPSPTSTPDRYICNTLAMVFHLPSCDYGRQLPWNNRRDVKIRIEAVNLGFSPCPYCNP